MVRPAGNKDCRLIRMQNRDIVVIGASAGGFDVLKKIISDLPTDIDAAIFIVWHIAPDVRGVLPSVLNQLHTLPAAHAIDYEPIKRGRIYVAPPDHHLVVEGNQMRITRGPKENRFRPAIDPLFRSAAYAFGPRVIGVVLSGALDDGSAGLWSVKEHGGIAIVQDPREAEMPSMPENAIRASNPDYILPSDKLGETIAQLVREEVPLYQTDRSDDRTKAELDIAMEKKTDDSTAFQMGELTRYTCPECHGVLSAIKEGGRTRFRCHTGHAFSANTLLSAITETVEDSLWAAVRSIQECVFLLNHMGDHFAEVNQPKLAATYFQKAKEAERRANIVRQTIENHERLSADAVAENLKTNGTITKGVDNT